MAWTTPETAWASSDAVGEDDLNAIGENLVYLNALTEFSGTWQPNLRTDGDGYPILAVKIYTVPDDGVLKLMEFSSYADDGTVRHAVKVTTNISGSATYTYPSTSYWFHAAPEATMYTNTSGSSATIAVYLVHYAGGSNYEEGDTAWCRVYQY